MRSNFKAICIASTEWQSEFEGILLMKDKKSSITEHWCRLKGNLLVFCKTADRKCEEILGIIILEYFSIQALNDPNSFKLVFASGDNPIILATKTKEEYYSWKQHISEARCNNFTQKIQGLKDEVLLLQKQIIDIDLSKAVDFVDEGANNGDKPGLELSLSCENLPHYAIETDPNPSISVFIINSLTKEEKLHSTTEIVQNSRNPVFHKIVHIPDNFYDPNIQIKFIIYDIRDIGSHTRHKIGVSQIYIQLLLNNSNLLLQLKNGYNQYTESNLRIYVKEYQSEFSKCDLFPKVQAFQLMTVHNLIKSYSFPTHSHKSLRVSEIMGESKFGLLVPKDYLIKLLREESLVQESLSRFGSSSTVLEKLRTDRHIASRENMNKYENILNFMSETCAQDKKFLPSCKKRDFLSSFIPVNLHINRILIIDEKTNEMANHLDIISVGCFSAHYLRFKNGGLHHLAKSYPDGLDKNSAINVANAMLRQYVQLVQDISDQLKHLCFFIISPLEDLEGLESKMTKFFGIFNHQFFTSLSLEQIRRDYHQLIFKIRDYMEGNGEAATSIKLIQVYSEKFEQSVENISLMVINILWPKILSALGSELLNFEWAEFSLRENIAFSQALGAVTTGISLACNTWSEAQWSQMAICGIPLYFEGFLSSYGDELGMMEDMKWVIDKFFDFTVIIRPDSKAPSFTLFDLNRIEITCLTESWKNAPIEIRMKKKIKLHLHPYFFNVGINEQQTFADRMNKNSLIHLINMNGYESMKQYFDRHVKNIGDSMQTCNGMEIIDSLNELVHEIQRNKNKPVKVLNIAQKISWAWSAIRFTSCKSAKDRTGMGLSLEQVRWLKSVGGMNKGYFTEALECIRSTGLRRDNCYKNIQCNKYAFNAFQLLSFPKNYKAPVGTYGANIS